MPYNTQQIKRDQQNSPIPQYFNPTTDVYEPLLGRNGANRVELYGPDGNPIATTEGKLAVRAAEIEMAIANLQTALLDNQSTAAKQDALAGLIGALDAVAVSDPTAAGAVIALLKGVLERFQAVERKIDAITDGTAPAKTETQLTGSTMEIYKATVAERPAANSVPVGACFMAVNTGEIWQSNGTDWVVMI